MLPDLKVVVCGIAFCVLLFVAAGGVTLPESSTHVGEMPELARPMMQESIAETPEAPPLFAMMAVAGDGAGLREAPRTDGGPAGADASGADSTDADGPGAEISSAAPSPHDPRGDPLGDLLDSLHDAPPAAADPPSPAGGGVRDRRALPPRRATARGRRHVPSVVQHHSYMRGSADVAR